MSRLAFPAALLCALLSLLPSTLVSQSLAASGETAPSSFTVRVEGSGRPMILIPGLMSSGEVWEGAVEHYRGRYRTHTLTLAGFAGVPPTGAGSFLETQRDAIVRYIQEQKLDRPVLVGHSLGAFLAYWVAATAPDLVGPVVAVDGVPYLAALADPGMTPERMRPQAAMIREMYAGFTPEQVAQQTRMVFQSQMKDPAHREMGVNWSRASDPATVGQAVEEMLTTDLRPVVAAIRVPVLQVAAGGAPGSDPAPVLSRYRAQVANVPEHRVVVVEGAGHFVMLDEPSALFSALDAFLAGR